MSSDLPAPQGASVILEEHALHDADYLVSGFTLSVDHFRKALAQGAMMVYMCII